MKSNIKVTDLFSHAREKETYVNVCAPMVRYSKVQFRTLVRNFGIDLCFTPMIQADSFCQNEKARCSEFSTTINDTPLIAQFAANNVDDFVDAANLIFPYADGIDLNCGCPQRWAIKDGYGCSLLTKPELIQDLVKSVKNSLPNNFSVSVKLRIVKDLKRTVSVCQQLEKSGVDFLTLHARTPEQKSSGSVDIEILKEVCKSVSIPVVGNGGVKTLSDAIEMNTATNCNGVMAASALLTNPTMFTGTHTTPVSCVKMWKDMKDLRNDKITFQCYHHHLVFMLDKVLSREQKQIFNHLSSFDKVDEFLDHYILNDCSNSLDFRYSLGNFVNCSFSEEITLKHSKKCRTCSRSLCYCNCIKYDNSSTNGTFFTTYVKESDCLDYMDCNLFDEII